MGIEHQCLNLMAGSPVLVSGGEFRQSVTFGVPGSGMLCLREPDPAST